MGLTMKGNCERPQKPILGQEAICPRGLGRVTDFNIDDKVVGQYIEVRTYVNDWSCRYAPENVTLVPIFPEHVREQAKTESKTPRVGDEVVCPYGEGVVTDVEDATCPMFIKIHRTGRTVPCSVDYVIPTDFSDDLDIGMAVAIPGFRTGKICGIDMHSTSPKVVVIPDGDELHPDNYEYLDPNEVGIMG